MRGAETTAGVQPMRPEARQATIAANRQSTLAWGARVPEKTTERPRNVTPQ